MSYRRIYDDYDLVDEQYYDATENCYISINQEYEDMIEELYERYLEDLDLEF